MPGREGRERERRAGQDAGQVLGGLRRGRGGWGGTASMPTWRCVQWGALLGPPPGSPQLPGWVPVPTLLCRGPRTSEPRAPRELWRI